MSVTPSSDLQHNMEYALCIANGVVDSNGNMINITDATAVFKTIA